MKTLLFVLLMSIAPLENSFFETSLKTIDDTAFSFRELKNKKAVVIVFMLTDCPASQSYSLTLNRLQEKYSKQNVQFVGIFPGSFSGIQEMKDFRKTYHIHFPLLKDVQMKLAAKLGATIAPEVFLIGHDGSIKYSGRIDDWLYALGKKRQVVTSHDLDNAIDDYLRGREIKNKKTNAIGCILQYD